MPDIRENTSTRSQKIEIFQLRRKKEFRISIDQADSLN